MLLRFTVDNYRSFGRPTTLDLSASNGLKDNPGKGVSEMGPAGRVLNSIAIYGANSSGKSNFLMAIGIMRLMVIRSVRLNDNEELPYEPFLLSTGEPRPTHFEIVYYESRTRSIFTYGFEYNESSILREWLYAKMPRKSEKKLLLRELGSDIHIDEVNYINDIDVSATRKLNNNRLFLSLAGQIGNGLSNRIIKWFDEDLRVLSGIEDTYSRYTRRKVYDSEDTRMNVQSFLSKMKLGFDQFISNRIDLDKIGIPQGLPQEIIVQLKKEPIIQISTVHNVYNESGTITDTLMLDLENQESAGTNKIFNLSGPILEALSGGYTLVIDELDSQMHPLISCRLVEMFNNPQENPNSAQLIFTTHDTNLLSRDVFRRDQVWFTEKDSMGRTTLYTMMKAQEINGRLGHAPRSDSNYQKNYIPGMYGAIPYLTCDAPSE